MEPAARARVAASLAREAAAHVSPVPAVDPETFLRGVVAVRRERELRALQLETAARRDALDRRRAPAAPRGVPRALSLAELEAPRPSVAVVVELVRAVDRHADVGRLLGGELGELHAERGEVQARDLLVEVFGSV